MDIYHNYGVDITVNATGDLALANDSQTTQQRIIRRLMTNPGGNVWHPAYGAGLGRFVGVTLTAAKEQEIKSLIISQILQEESVAKSPAPQIVITKNSQGLVCQINYVESKTKNPVVLAFQVTA